MGFGLQVSLTHSLHLAITGLSALSTDVRVGRSPEVLIALVTADVCILRTVRLLLITIVISLSLSAIKASSAVLVSVAILPILLSIVSLLSWMIVLGLVCFLVFVL